MNGCEDGSDEEVDDPWLEALAASGDISAMTELGELLEESDLIRAESLLRTAAATGDPVAMGRLGSHLWASQPAEARAWMDRAVAAGDERTAVELGHRLWRTELDRAISLLRPAAHGGNAWAMFGMGEALMDSSPGESRRWFEKAIAEGVEEALFPFAYLLDRLGLQDDAIPYYELAAANGEVDAMVELGAILCDRGDDAGTRYLNEAMELGSVLAAFALGNYREMTDPPGAVSYYEKAAQSGHRDAMVRLAQILDRTVPAEADHWWRLAASLGDKQAKLALRMNGLMRKAWVSEYYRKKK